jgi:hypothetical protein
MQPTVSFDPLNRELRSCWPFFADRNDPTAPVDIKWIDGIDTVTITAQMVLGQWIFSSPTTPPIDIIAPHGCSGTVSGRNQGVAFHLLQSPPSQVLLVLKR